MDQRRTATTAVNDQKGGEQMNKKMVYSVNEAAEQLGVGRTMVYELIGEGRLPSMKLGQRRLVAKADLEAFVDALRRGEAA